MDVFGMPMKGAANSRFRQQGQNFGLKNCLETDDVMKETFCI
jgi:hypothetical protein